MLEKLLQKIHLGLLSSAGPIFKAIMSIRRASCTIYNVQWVLKNFGIVRRPYRHPQVYFMLFPCKNVCQ